MRVFAGLASDPFFMDVEAAIRTDMSGTLSFDTAANTVQDRDCLAIVVEVPSAPIVQRFDGASLIAAIAENMVTRRGKPIRIERVGRPEIKNVIMANPMRDPRAPGVELRDLYNREDAFALSPVYRPLYESRLDANLAFFDGLDGATAWPVGPDGRHPLRDLLMDDFLILDLAHPFAPGGFLEIERALLEDRPHDTAGGRWLGDDILDELLTLDGERRAGRAVRRRGRRSHQAAQPDLSLRARTQQRADLPLPGIPEELNMETSERQRRGRDRRRVRHRQGDRHRIHRSRRERAALRPQRQALDAAARELGDRAIGRVTDVSDESQVEAAMRAAREAFGSLDIVVNCAGFGAIMPLIELPDEKWRAVQAVTLGGVFYGVKHGARLMLEQGRPGVIINISSVNGRQAGEGQAAYCAAKAGVDMLTRCGALELGGRGIRVVGIAPGLVETPLTRQELENPAMRELFLGAIPMNRAVAAEEIAAAAVFLASDGAQIHQRRDDRHRRRLVDARLSGAADRTERKCHDRARTLYERPHRGRQSFGDRSKAWSFAVSKARSFEDLVALSKLLFLRGDLLGRIADHDRAEPVAKEAIALAPRCGGCALIRARLAGRFHRFNEAPALLDQRARRRASGARDRAGKGGAAPGDRPIPRGAGSP